MRSRLVTVMLAAALMVSGGTAAVFAGGNSGGGGNAGKAQYKPGCGPKKSNGVNPSGTHTGQPSKGPNRQDCPD